MITIQIIILSLINGTFVSSCMYLTNGFFKNSLTWAPNKEDSPNWSDFRFKIVFHVFWVRIVILKSDVENKKLFQGMSTSFENIIVF